MTKKYILLQFKNYLSYQKNTYNLFLRSENNEVSPRSKETDFVVKSLFIYFFQKCIIISFVKIRNNDVQL